MIDVCIHHQDLDGWCSAAIVGASTNVGVGYKNNLNSSTLLNLCTGRTVAIVDFSFPLATMKFIKDISKKLIWIDHHLSSEPCKELNLQGIHQLDKAGCELTAEFFNHPLVDSISMIGDRDIRANIIPEARSYCYGLGLLPVENPKHPLWSELLNDNQYTRELIERGKIIQSKIDNDLVWQSRLRVHKVTLNSQSFLLMNCTADMSDASDYMIETFKIHPILLWDVSKAEVHLHGRGEGALDMFNHLLRGHPSACGGTLPLTQGLEFIRELMNHSQRIMPS